MEERKQTQLEDLINKIENIAGCIQNQTEAIEGKLQGKDQCCGTAVDAGIGFLMRLECIYQSLEQSNKNLTHTLEELI